MNNYDEWKLQTPFYYDKDLENNSSVDMKVEGDSEAVKEFIEKVSSLADDLELELYL